MRIAQTADALVNEFAGTSKYDKVSAARGFCNSDSAFVAWVKKTGYSLQVIRNARVLQQAWKTLGFSRTILITVRAIKAAMLKLLAGYTGGDKKTIIALLAAIQSGVKPTTFVTESNDSLIAEAI